MTGAVHRPSRQTRLRLMTAVMVAAVVLLIAGVAGAVVGPARTVPSAPRPTPAPAASGPARSGPIPARPAVEAFLHTYMDPDGRVVRRDQGGDTVSEGEAYAMLMAAAIGDRHSFDLAWSWTESHLLEPDGLLAWHWSGGRVADSQPASDADLGAAAALVMAASRFSDPAYLASARRMAGGIAANEEAPSADGTTLVAGPWARRPPASVDPSYLAPAEIHQLVQAFGGPWTALAATSARQLESLTSGGALPPDWAVIGSDGAVSPSGPPDQSSGPARFGFDAVRVPIWMVSACNAGLQAAAASLRPALQRGHGQVGLDRNGRPDPGTSHPVGLLAEAAADLAAGQPGPAWSLVDQAAREDASHPTYYGAAWIALAELGFEHQLESCPAS